ncbi:pilus assembly protein PilM, partial [Candidatus Poribacteria bacterium]|nr:pilus assembly protein PilM [Candidatus Poribacteria bacterium]
MAKNQVVSIDIGTNAIKLVQLEQTASGRRVSERTLRLVSAGIELYPRTSATEDIDDQTIRQTLQKVWRKVQGRVHSVVLSLPRSSVTSRRLTNLPPAATDEQLTSLVAIQAETELPF